MAQLAINNPDLQSGSLPVLTNDERIATQIYCERQQLLNQLRASGAVAEIVPEHLAVVISKRENISGKLISYTNSSSESAGNTNHYINLEIDLSSGPITVAFPLEADEPPPNFAPFIDQEVNLTTVQAAQLFPLARSTFGDKTAALEIAENQQLNDLLSGKAAMIYLSGKTKDNSESLPTYSTAIADTDAEHSDFVWSNLLGKKS